MLKAYLTLTKSGIVLFVLVSALAAYSVSYPVGMSFDWKHLSLLMLGLYFLCAGSFSLNQAQEWKKDREMPRTKNRPIPAGLIAPWQAYFLAAIFIPIGSLFVYLVDPMSGYLGMATVLLYNGLYTLFWKKRWVFAAVPGAIPGAMPALIGYTANGRSIFDPAAVYLFLIMFLWQMPHFWVIAIRYRDDYGKGGFPVLPAALGKDRTLYHMGLYTFVYVSVALASPWIIKANVLYLLLVFPISLKLIYEFFKYFKSVEERAWLSFFLWVNLSLIVFLGVPIFDRWFFFWANS